jgi:hypothetical protein
MSYTNYKISYISLSKADLVMDGVTRYWVFVEADYPRLYAQGTLEELITHLKKLKESPEYACETINIERESKEERIYSFDEKELEELAKIAPLVCRANFGRTSCK